MAWRIHDSVIRGIVDNREKGRVRGQLWFDGLDEPVVLDLEGNCWPDLAGCLLEFKNPLKTIPLRKDATMALLQDGSAGDITASRKVRVFDIPVEEAYIMCKRGEKPPEHMANCLYLEWFSVRNGRVVIESTDFELTISAPEWRMTPQEDEERARQAASGMANFMQKLTEAIETHQQGQKDPDEEWDEHDYERFMKESDARTDKYMELLEKYGDSDEAEEKIAKEMDWDHDDEEADDGGAEGERMSVEEINRICEEAANAPEPEPEPHLEGIDWIRTEDGDIRHPLQHRCFESAMRLWDECDELGLDDSEDEDQVTLITEFQIASVKLGGALSGIARGQGPRDGAFTVAYLKRALDHLHKAQAGLEAVAPKKLLPEEIVNRTRKEMLEIRQEILDLMDKFRGRA